MSLDQTTALEHAKQYAQLVVKQLNPLKIVLYGSFAKGNWNENSDIDIAVVVSRIDNDYLLVSTQLNKLTRGIDNRIEPILLQQGYDPSGFLSSVLQTGITLYSE